MYKKRYPVFDSYDSYVSYNYRQYKLDEAYHVFKNCQDAIDEISRQIYDCLMRKDYTDFVTKFAYCPELKRTVRDSESEYDDSYPVRITFEDSIEHWDMVVQDRADYPDEVVITVNIHITDFTEEENLKDFIHTKLTHEFGHVRQNYGQRDRDISQSRKYMSTDIDEDIFEYPSDDIKNECMRIVKDFMYAFAPAEMQQRCAELHDAVVSRPVNELERIAGQYDTRTDSVTRIIDMYEYIHGIEQMKKLIWQTRNAVRSVEFLIVLVIAWYFKEANLYKPKQPLNKGFIQSFLDGHPIDNADAVYANQFISWLESHTRRYVHNIYTVVHYILYTRVWHFSDRMRPTTKLHEMKEFFEKIFTTKHI